MQKFFRQPSDAATARSLCFHIDGSPGHCGLSLGAQRHSFLAPKPRTCVPSSLHPPKSTANVVKESATGLCLAKVIWLRHALERWQHEHTLATTSRWYPLEYDACALLFSWLHQSLLAPFFCGFDALAVQNRCAGRLIPSIGLAHLRTQRTVDTFESAVVTPAPEVIPNHSVRRKIVRQSTPRAAVGQLIQQSVDDLALGVKPARTARTLWLDQRAQHLPLCLAQITGIALAFHKCKSNPFLYTLLEYCHW